MWPPTVLTVLWESCFKSAMMNHGANHRVEDIEHGQVLDNFLHFLCDKKETWKEKLAKMRRGKNIGLSPILRGG